MKIIKKLWNNFLKKSIWGKLSDLFFIVFLITVLTKDGRFFLQQTMLSTGFFGNIEANANVLISDENWNWKLFDEEGNEVFLGDFKGQKVFINTWGTWCPPCNAEMPYIIDLMEKVPDTKYLFVTTEKPDRVKSHLTKKGWDIPVFYAPSIPINELQYSSLPTTFIIDENGVLIHRSEGMKKWNSNDVIELLKS